MNSDNTGTELRKMKKEPKTKQKKDFIKNLLETLDNLYVIINKDAE
ncbi:MAG: hypothetical protein QMD06_03475 [Candidatus Altarchaeum sp.]|nr:hypothetical protein [Candidatus Altarchaeum sp.]